MSSLLLNIFLCTCGFQLLLRKDFISPIYLAEPHDYSFVATIIILIINISAVVRIVQNSQLARYLAIYLTYIFFLVMYSVLVLDYDLVPTLQSSRVYLWPSFFFLFTLVPRKNLIQLTKILLIIIVIASLLYLIQVSTNIPIISRDFAELQFNPLIEGTNIRRYIAVPYFLYIFTAILFIEIFKNKLVNAKTIGILILLNSVLFLSYTRTGIIATAIGLTHIAKSFVSPRKILIYLSVVLLILVMFIKSSEDLANRFYDGIKEIPELIGTVDLAKIDTDKVDISDSTFTFRYALFLERFQYIYQNPKYWAFGLGMIHEKSEAASKLHFKIGLVSSTTGEAPQIDTADNDWVLILIRTGAVGLLIILFILKAIHSSIPNNIDIFSMTAKSSSIYFFITSFLFAVYTQPQVMIQFMLVLVLALTKNVNIKQNNCI